MSSAGPLTAGPSTTITTGTTPEQSAIARAARPHPCRAGRPSAMSAPLDRTTATSGRPFVRATIAAASICDDEALDNAPCFSVASTSTHTTSRPSTSRTSASTMR